MLYCMSHARTPPPFSAPAPLPQPPATYLQSQATQSLLCLWHLLRWAGVSTGTGEAPAAAPRALNPAPQHPSPPIGIMERCLGRLYPRGPWAAQLCVLLGGCLLTGPRMGNTAVPLICILHIIYFSVIGLSLEG